MPEPYPYGSRGPPGADELASRFGTAAPMPHIARCTLTPHTNTTHRTLPARCLWRHYVLHCTPQGCRSLAAGSTRPSTRALPRQPRSGTRHRRRRWRARCSLSRAGTGRRASPPPSRTARKSRLGVPPAAGAGCAQGRERWGWGPGNPVPRVLEDLVRSFLRSRYTGVRSSLVTYLTNA